MGYDPELDTSPELDPDVEDDQIGDNQYINQGVVIVVPCSASQRGTYKSSITCHGPCWS